MSIMLARWSALAVVVGAMVGGPLYLAVALQDSKRSAWELFLGNRGLADLVLSIGTFMAAMVTVYFLMRRARHDDRSIELTRFKEATSLLGEDKETAVITALHLLFQMARERPKAYLEIAARAVAGYATDSSRDAWKEFYAFKEAGAKEEVPPVKRSPNGVRYALATFGDMRRPGNDEWISANAKDRDFGLILGDLVLHQIEVTGHNFSRCTFANTVTGKMVFIDCGFRDTHFFAYCHQPLEFKNCDLRGATFTLSEVSVLIATEK